MPAIGTWFSWVICRRPLLHSSSSALGNLKSLCLWLQNCCCYGLKWQLNLLLVASSRLFFCAFLAELRISCASQASTVLDKIEVHFMYSNKHICSAEVSMQMINVFPAQVENLFFEDVDTQPTVRLNHSEHFRETPQGKGINTVSRFRQRALKVCSLQTARWWSEETKLQWTSIQFCSVMWDHFWGIFLLQD